MLITSAAVNPILTNRQREELNQLVADGLKAVHEWLDKAELAVEEAEEVFDLQEEAAGDKKMEIDWDAVRKAREEARSGLTAEQSVNLGLDLFSDPEEYEDLKPRLLPRIKHLVHRFLTKLNPFHKEKPQSLADLIASVDPFKGKTTDAQAELQRKQEEEAKVYEESVMKLTNLRPLLDHLLMAVPPKPAWDTVIERINKLKERTRIKAGPVRSVNVRPGHTLGLDVEISDEIELSPSGLSSQVRDKAHLQNADPSVMKLKHQRLSPAQQKKALQVIETLEKSTNKGGR